MYERNSRFFSPIVDSWSPNCLLLFIMCSALVSAIQRYDLLDMEVKLSIVRGTQQEYSSKPLKRSIVEHILVFKRRYGHMFIP